MQWRKISFSEFFYTLLNSTFVKKKKKPTRKAIILHKYTSSSPEKQNKDKLNLYEIRK